MAGAITGAPASPRYYVYPGWADHVQRDLAALTPFPYACAPMRCNTWSGK
jgi:hypothetical protein